MISKTEQLNSLQTPEFAVTPIKVDVFQIQLFSQVSAQLDISKYPKKPKLTLEKNIAKIIGDFEIYLPEFRSWDINNPPLLISVIRGLKRTLETVSGKVVHISEALLKELCAIANEHHPLESFEFLRCIDGVLKEYVLAPRAYKSEKSVVFFSRDVDTDHTLVASCHSHPTNNFHPSDADLETFRKKPVNIILGYPYRSLNLGVYDQRGQSLSYSIDIC